MKYKTTKMTIEDLNKLRIFFREKPEGGSTVSLARGRYSLKIVDSHNKGRHRKEVIRRAAKKLREMATKLDMLAEELRPSALVVLRRVNARKVG